MQNQALKVSNLTIFILKIRRLLGEGCAMATHQLHPGRQRGGDVTLLDAEHGQHGQHGVQRQPGHGQGHHHQEDQGAVQCPGHWVS